MTGRRSGAVRRRAARIEGGAATVDLRSAPVPPPAAGDHVRGESGQPLVIVYGEYSCPRCALADARLRASPVRLAFRHFAVAARSPRSVALACAAEAAALQGRFWEMHDALFADQGHLDDPHLWQRARALALDLERFERDRRSAAVHDRVREHLRGGLRAGVVATPTLVRGGVLHPGVPEPEWLRAGAPVGRAAGLKVPGPIRSEDSVRE